jgi:type IX secretion system PorP/SprF family membrane protein
MTSELLAQQDEQMSFYQYNQSIFNPSCAGIKGRMNCTSVCRFQWVQFSGAPNSQWLSIQSSVLNNRLGIGANFIHDQVGMRGRTGINILLASRINLNKNQHLRLGLSLGLDQYDIDFTEAIVGDPNDALASYKVSTKHVNAGFGIFYCEKKFNLGFSIPRVFLVLTKSNAQHVNIFSTHYYLTISREFEINNSFKWRQSFLLKYVRNAPITIDLNSTLVVKNRIDLGFHYRIHEALGISGLARVKERLKIGYNFDFPINGLFTFQQGTHELMLQFDLKDKKTEESTPKF